MTVGPGTTVAEQGQSATLIAADRSIGRRVRFTGSLAVNLESLGNVQATEPDFTGTGVSAATDAGASAQQAQIPASFASTAFTARLPVQFTGFVAPFGAAPPDFSASAVISLGQARAKLQALWSAPGTMTAFTALSSTELVIGQAALEAVTVHTIGIADTEIDASSLSGGVPWSRPARAATRA